ncbi:hypothetical protein MNBD_ALPHA06-300 [hydrothermal vent metagenome]|uniref:Uncharacterized protein n=1 Tax=hydrothermal vent metagenome TaxID=652676 RepID=A0A3B0R9D8_9ZZZZ
MMRAFIFILAIWFAAPAIAKEAPRNTLYLVTTMRAAPAELKSLIADLKSLKADGYYEHAQRTAPLIMRHSQGDQWDLMLLEPVGSYQAFFAKKRMQIELEAKERYADTIWQLEARLAFREELFAWGPNAEFVGEHVKDAGLFHIEMFDAAPAMKAKLIEQREMENQYLQATKRRGNLIFVADMGSNVDAFTIGAYKDLAAFAARPDLPEGTSLKAAKDAGFTDDNSIGFYLRELISAHHDTLAVLVE